MDSDEKIIFQSKRGSPFKWRTYHAEYYHESDSFRFEMKQKDLFKVPDQTRFLFDGTYFDLKAEFGRWAVITEEKSRKQIARWRISFIPPIDASFEILDESCRRHELLFLGAFHTYLYGE
ncbi:hypothetical protein FO441_03645 [Salinicoccus cyprini]|uniref:Tubby C-terminal domain-containing protein n=1 Tax=Salinicoccus cyprini TaxID=2493691 RepID=A0A558AYP9_9STAP|nr:hypothetical protein FO441_03645 [Salinicoccus cyprini]